MTKKEISNGVVHNLPNDLRNIILSKSDLLLAWEDITPLARNEWICWIESAKKPKTRINRIKRSCSDLIKGKRRPCCWAGCIHRKGS